MASSTSTLSLLFLSGIALLGFTTQAFTPSLFGRSSSTHSSLSFTTCQNLHNGGIVLRSSSSPSDNEDDISSENNEEGLSLASDFFKALERRNIQLEEGDFLGDEDDEDDEEDDDEDSQEVTNRTDDEDDDEDEDEINIPEGAINAFKGVDPKAGDVTLTNDQVYSELKERVLESAGGFVDLVSGADDEEDDDDDDDAPPPPEVYETPKTVPDSELTAGEVVTTVLAALNHNDIPNPDRGIEVLFGYSSPGSAISQAIQVERMTPSEYGAFLKEETEYAVLFNHEEVVIDKGDYSFDRKKAFFTARLRVGPGPLDFTSVNFILSSSGEEEEDCWLIDSFLIRPEGMRRRRRR